jgi:predicted permease
MRRFLARLAKFFCRQKAEQEMVREMRAHLALLEEELERRGLPPEEAKLAALRSYGGVEQSKELHREARSFIWLEQSLKDLQYAIRGLLRTPAFTATAVVTLALGIGANTAIFTLIKRSYLEMLPVRNPQQIVQITRSTMAQPEMSSFSYPLYREMADPNTPLEGIVCTSGARVSLVGADDRPAESISIELVSGNFYQLLGVQPLLGRLLTPDDDRHPGAHPVVVLSHNYWRRRFSSDPNIVGTKVRINTCPMTVIGVAPPGFDGLNTGMSPDAVLPLMMHGEAFQTPPRHAARGHWWLNVAGRLRPGATYRQAELALQHVLQTYFAERAQQPGTSEYVRSVYESNRVHVRPMATGWHRNPAAAADSMALLGITAMVLLVACTNLANLLLARAAARGAEMSLRLALGAGRFRLLRQLLTESLLLAALGGALGLALAIAAGPAVLRLAKGDDPRITQSSAPDATILLFCFAATTLCGLLFGLAPAWHAFRTDLNQGIGASRTVAGTRLIGRKLLLSAQLALTLVLLTGAALLVRSLRNLQTADLGFMPEYLLQVTLTPRNAGYSDAHVLPYVERTIERIRSIPAVKSASIAAIPVLAGSSWGSGIRVEGVRISESQTGPDRNAVGPHYFATMGIPIVLGRDFSERDGEAAPPVAIVNEAFARSYFGKESPIGRRIDQASDSKTPPRFTIVGVAKDGKYRRVRETATAFWYIPLAQSGMRSYLTLYVRAMGDPSHAVADVRRAIAAVDPNVATLDVRTVEAQIAGGRRFERMIALLATIFGTLAAALAAIGLYGVLSYFVNQRQREIGIRMALGSTPGAVARLVVSNVTGWAALGIVLALPAVYYGSQAVRNLLFEVQPMDPTALACGAGVLAAMASLAAWLPARRASRLDPSAALRTE